MAGGRSQRRKVLTQGEASNGETIADYVPGGGVPGGGGEESSPITALAPTEASIINVSAPGTVVATLVPTGGIAPFTFTMTDNPAAFSLMIDGDRIVTQYSPVSPAGGATEPVTITVADSIGQTFAADVMITVGLT